MAFHLTQGTFSYLPPFTDEEILSQIRYMVNNGWAVSVEFTDDPHPRNVYWEMWGLPMFEVNDPAAVMYEINECRKAYPNHYIRVSAYDRSFGRQTTALSFIVNRPKNDPGFGLERQESRDRQVRYTIRSYAADRPEGSRFG